MSDILFACPACGQSLQTPPEYAGQTTECPACSQAMVIPEPPQEDPTEPAAAPAAGCPDCGAELPPDSVLCLQCGYHLTLKKKLTTEFS